MMRSKAQKLVAPALFVGSALALVVSACGGEAATPTPPPAPTATPAPTARPAATPAPTTVAPTATPAPGRTPVPTPPPTATRPPAAPTATPAPTATAAPAPTAAPADRPRLGGVLEMGSIWPNANGYYVANPNKGALMAGSEVVNNIYSQLVFFDPYQNAQVIVGDLAQSWQLNAAGTLLTLRLRRNAMWHDGKPFVAADVVYSFKVRTDVPEGWRSTLYPARLKSSVKSITAVDDGTVAIELVKPSASFVPFLTHNGFKVLPAHIPLDDQAAKGIGTGPFKVKNLRRDASIELVKNDSYWNKDASGTPLPYLDGINIAQIADPALLYAAFRTGRALYLNNINPPAVTGREEIIQREIAGAQFFPNGEANYGLVLNNKAPLDDIRVRLAIDLWMNRKQLNDLGFQGNANRGSVLPGPMRGSELKGLWGLPDDERVTRPGWRMADAAGRAVTTLPDFRAKYDGLKKEDRDLKQAKELLAQAGVKPGSFKAEVPGCNGCARIGETVAQQLSDLFGSQFTFLRLTSADNTDRLVKGNFLISISTMGGGLGIDEPEFDLATWIPGSQQGSFGNWDISRYGPMIQEQDGTLDVPKRRDQLWRLQRELLKDDYRIPLLVPQSMAVAWPQVRNVPPPIGSADNSLFYERIWLAPTPR